MSALGKQLFQWVQRTEQEHPHPDGEQPSAEQATSDRYLPLFHLVPPVGWLNDPNGLCQFQGKYHFFFQYSPFEVGGGLKFWGHFTSEDMLHQSYQGAALAPDTPYDCHGVYSGSAIEHEGKLHLFYTGNIKLDGDYDYINNGREAYTIKVTTEDGLHFSTKQVVLRPSDYPEECTAHVRDPKLYQVEDGSFRMVLGARLKGEAHRGAVLIYSSKDLECFTFEKIITSDQPFGFMWECPDVFSLAGAKILSLSPQGLDVLPHRFQNIYQSGYFTSPELTDEEEGKQFIPPDALDQFREWDMGFDFYAPQSFEDESGRRILVGWAGMPDADYSSLPEKESWQHCFTVPREVTIRDGQIYQWPVKEVEQMLDELIADEDVSPDDSKHYELKSQMDVFISSEGTPLGDFEITVGEHLSFKYKDNILKLEFTEDVALPASADGKYTGPGLGRKIRTAKSMPVYSLRILFDASILEIFVNDGATVFTTRIFDEGELNLGISSAAGHIKTYTRRKQLL